jgi:hypothetical protein
MPNIRDSTELKWVSQKCGVSSSWIVGCLEDHMDFREEVDRITKKGSAKEELKVCLRPDDAEIGSL